jgi:dihydrofolate synthase/folylpolyglutamate synthase
MKDLAQALERLYALRTFGIKPGLEATAAFLERLGNPHHTFAAIHVAGTNGKGSVCAMLDAVLRQAGLRPGLYTSPHLIRFNERIRVDGAEITDEALGELFECLEPHAAEVARAQGGRDLTFFEFTSALAFEHFRRQGVKIAVIETGLGGRLDATNVVFPLVSVITRIGLEHTQYLGDTLEAIAGEKAGIVKAGRPVVCGATPDEARGVIRQRAAALNTAFVDAAEAVTARRVSQSLEGQTVALAGSDTDYGRVRVALLGRHQLENVATAVATLEAVARCSPLTFDGDVVRAGLAAARWPGRLQVLAAEPPVVLDGAHNPDGARMLAAALKELFRKRKVALVWGMCDDKDALGFAKALGGVIRRCWTVPIATERSLSPARLLRIAGTEGWEASEAASVKGAIAEAIGWARERDGAVCIAGSLFLAGEVLKAGVDG